MAIDADAQRRKIMTATETEHLKSLDEWGIDFRKELGSLEKINATRLVEIAEEVGKFLVKGKYRVKRGPRLEERTMDLRINQVRRFLDSIRRTESEIKGKAPFEQIQDQIILLRPKLAYAAGREERVKPLMNVLDPAIKSGAQSRDNFNKLLRLVEGIVAYHRYYGGSN